MNVFQWGCSGKKIPVGGYTPAVVLLVLVAACLFNKVGSPWF